MAFSNKKSGLEDKIANKTLPMPVICDSCGFELPDDAEKNSGYFVNFLICKDLNRNAKSITGVPSTFMIRGADGKIKGGSDSGYHLKDNFIFMRWVIWCIECHAEKSRLQDMSRRTNMRNAV